MSVSSFVPCRRITVPYSRMLWTNGMITTTCDASMRIADLDVCAHGSTDRVIARTDAELAILAALEAYKIFFPGTGIAVLFSKPHPTLFEASILSLRFCELRSLLAHTYSSHYRQSVFIILPNSPIYKIPTAKMQTKALLLALVAATAASAASIHSPRQNNNNNAGAANAAAAADFGQCTPTMDFQLGRPGRKADEGTFLPTDALVAKGQQDALNPSIIMNRICDQLTNVCDANDAAVAACEAAQASTEALGTRDASTADAFNSALGF
ncbi:hypothetical protein F4825DRAFT_421920 [Nemania diffusa]|nr:hypothetical protein F4825DRAFT_421920 [Nemania diffusa]